MKGFATVSVLSYSDLEKSAVSYFSAMEPQEGQTFKVNSRVVTVSVSNRNTSHLEQPVKLTFDHLEQVADILQNVTALCVTTFTQSQRCDAMKDKLIIQ